MCRVQSPRLATIEALSQIMRIPEVEIPDLRALVAHHDRRQAGHLWRLWRGRLNPWIGFAPLNGLPHKSAHMPRSFAPISMLTADCGAEVSSASTAIGAAVRVTRGSMSSDKNRERGANM